LLATLQADSQSSLAQLADRVGLSSSACHRRMRALEKTARSPAMARGWIPRKIGLNLHALIDITLESQSREAMERFERAALDSTEILECYLISGVADYRLRIAARDMADYDRLHRDCLARLPGVSAMHTSFVICPIKAWNGYALA
jgi:DNA-binding Lrp family transcriptional regulator